MTSLIALLALTSCAGPFTDVKASASSGSVSVSSCGSSSARAASVIQAMDNPPLGESGHTIEPPREVTFCVRVENNGDQPVQVDRSRLHLQCPRERQPWIPDTDDKRFVVPPRDARRFHVTFAYSPLLSGEDVKLVFDDALTRSERAIALAALVLRKR